MIVELSKSKWYKLDSLIHNNNLLETNSTKPTGHSYSDASRHQKDNSFALLNSTDIENKPDDSNSSTSSLILTRNRSKTNSNKTKANCQTLQPKKTIFSYLVQVSQTQPTTDLNSNQEAKQKAKESETGVKKNSSRNKSRQRLSNQPTESSVASSSSSQTKPNSSNIVQYLSNLYENNNKEKLEQIFSTNSLFSTSQSLLTKLDLKVLFQPAIFESLPRQSQLKLIKLLPECDRLFDSHGSFNNQLRSQASKNKFRVVKLLNV
ncbi:hypothetical protein BpHYR1_035837 [Brachionus plicatilis]|uniref:ASX DEUBAD domain-containing protein n=1 Tax=Brachionus plicatilis TaxID=10195 RepID=A0A3M7PQX2_BRAPC|nr:hypothetical protein BpHYR1_035837 [Brachionus plicatilis]